MVYQPDNAYTKKYGYQFGQFITNPTQHLAGSNVFTQYSYTKKENKKYSIQHGENGRVEMNNDRSIDIIAGADGDTANILVHNRNGTIDISVGENGEVRINAQNVTFHADNIMKLEGKKVQVEATDEFSLQAPFAHSSGHRGNLVPLSFLDVATSGQFVGADIISKFKTEGVAKLAGLSEKLNDVTPSLTQKLGDLSGTIGDVQDQVGGALKGIEGQLPGMKTDLMNLSSTMNPVLKDIATSPGVTNLGASLQQSVAGFNFGGGLVPKGF